MQDTEYMSIAPEPAKINNPNATPFENIKAAAAAFGIDVKDPNPKCKHCFGRGYTGINVAHNREPIPCKCIMPEMNAATEKAYEDRQWVPRNRKERRYAQKMMRRV